MKNKGKFSYRLKREANNPREVAFAKVWENQNELSKVLDHLLGDGTGRNNPTPTPQQREIAATVVQWLGSNVGMNFLELVINSSADVKSYLSERVFNQKVRKE